MDIKATREAMGLTVSQFASKIGVVPSTIYRLEDGKIALTTRMTATIKAVAGKKVIY